jgi:hypothetical protein
MIYVRQGPWETAAMSNEEQSGNRYERIGFGSSWHWLIAAFVFYILSTGPVAGVYARTLPHGRQADMVLEIVYAPVRLVEDTSLYQPIEWWVRTWEPRASSTNIPAVQPQETKDDCGRQTNTHDAKGNRPSRIEAQNQQGTACDPDHSGDNLGQSLVLAFAFDRGGFRCNLI